MKEITYTLEREFRASTRAYTHRTFFTVTPGRRLVRVESGLGPAYYLDITDARAHWKYLLSLKAGRFGGGFAEAWKWVNQPAAPAPVRPLIWTQPDFDTFRAQRNADAGDAVRAHLTT